MGRGGARLGAGRKPKSFYIVPPGVSAATAARAGGGEPAPPPPIQAPKHLSAAERTVWARYAPLAQASGLLTAERVPGFEHLCEIVATYDRLKKRVDKEGWMVAGKRHDLWPQLQTYAVRRESALRSYGLFANGRPAASAAPPANPWSTL